MSSEVLVPAWIVVALALDGCGLSLTQPQSTSTGPRAASKVAEAQATHEYPSPAPPAQHAPGVSSAQGAIAAFAQAYVNWNARTVARRMAALARTSVGQARSELTLAAAETNGDYELRRGGIANSGTVETVSPRRGHPGQFVVVTLEATSAANATAYLGLRPAWHVTIATVRDQGSGRWVVSGWTPES